MQNKYPIIVLILAAAYNPTSLCAEQTAQAWVATPSLVDKLEARDLARGWITNFREENIPAYTLPDLLKLADGSKVVDAVGWQSQRRPEIIELFRKHAYGRAPVGRPKGMTFNVYDHDPNAMGGLATRKQIEINFSGSEDSLKMNLVVFIPNKVEGPAPSFLLISHRGIENLDPTRETKSGLWPAEEMVGRGYVAAAFYAGDLDEDEFDEFKDGVHAQFDKPGPRPVDAWGTLAAWAWGASRAMDYFETVDEIDHRRVGVVGHSRGGKTSLWAGARDERFALVVSNSSGCGGAALSRRKIGNPVDILNRKHPHWYCENYRQYDSKEETMPFDQHMLLALVAPRLLYVASASDDLWADPRGEFLGAL
ncbi:MAG: prolyl oligopeptidase family serine peptidase, partial [Verrucomicrobia bacterium]|nr:prolyl oligopeptidase family serine peptidase [Verrucomicrobiota bacterium]